VSIDDGHDMDGRGLVLLAKVHGLVASVSLSDGGRVNRRLVDWLK
jgi:hypothetical protein